MGLETGSSSSLGSFRDRLPRERYRGSVGLGGFWGLAPRDRACARRKARGRGCFRAMREGVRCSPSTLAPARSRCRWVAFGDRLLLLVRDRLRSGGWESFRWGVRWVAFGDRLLLLVRDRLVEGTGCSRPVPLRLGVGMGFLATAWSGCACGLGFGHDSTEGVGPLFHGRTLQAH